MKITPEKLESLRYIQLMLERCKVKEAEASGMSADVKSQLISGVRQELQRLARGILDGSIKPISKGGAPPA